MKYNESNKPIECIMTHSTCYNGTTKFTDGIKGILIHSTGANNPYIKRYVQPYETDANYKELISILGKNKNGNDWNHVTRKAGVNAFIGQLADGTVTTVQTLPWDYAPWGCGRAYTGGPSCNEAWIQFEICEDGLKDKQYFNAIYQEACELIAYLCKMHNLDPEGKATFHGKQVPVITCHKDANTLGFASAHADIHHWFKLYGKDMKTIINDVKDIIEESNKPKEMYRVRKSWSDSASQVGAFRDLDKAIAACDKAGPGYSVYNSAGVAVYSVPVPTPTPVPEAKKIKKGDIIELINGAVYSSGKKIPSYIVRAKPLYARTDEKDGKIVFSTLATGAVTGTIYTTQIKGHQTPVEEKNNEYMVMVNTALLNVRKGPGTNYAILGTVKQGNKYTITEEKGTWGKLKNKEGWVSLKYVKKV